MTADEAAAIRFRESMGFTTDLSVVRSEAADELISPSELGGTPLTDSETAEVIRRMNVQWATEPAMKYANDEPEFAGGYIDQRGGGVPVFLFTDGIDSHKESIAKVLQEPIEFRVERAARSLDELLAQQATILAELDRLPGAGASVVETAILPDRNAVLVGGNGFLFGVVGKVNGDSQMLNEVVYRYGRRSGTNSGLINGLYGSRQSCVDVSSPQCMTVTKTIRVDFDSLSGDSGGPVWQYVTFPGGSTAVVAMGTHVHSENHEVDPAPWFGWYSPVDVGAAQYDEFWGLYTLCTQTVC